ncbi:hypothetical protein BD779DRAFT_828975 [Infundibulicybe gibba]|nr:hypothetical protein BD779DRAFT_828975 [Infundibulicybe gibba]
MFEDQMHLSTTVGSYPTERPTKMMHIDLKAARTHPHFQRKLFEDHTHLLGASNILCPLPRCPSAFPTRNGGIPPSQRPYSTRAHHSFPTAAGRGNLLLCPRPANTCPSPYTGSLFIMFINVPGRSIHPANLKGVPPVRQ